MHSCKHFYIFDDEIYSMLQIFQSVKEDCIFVTQTQLVQIRLEVMSAFAILDLWETGLHVQVSNHTNCTIDYTMEIKME